MMMNKITQFSIVSGLCVLIMAPCLAQNHEWGWVKVGGGGALMGTFYHPNKPGYIGLRSDVGGCFYRDENSPDEWIMLLNSVNFSHAVNRSTRNSQGFCFDPGNENILYLVAASSFGDNDSTDGLYRSKDKGQTWSLIRNQPGDLRSSAKVHECVAVDPQNSDVIYFGTQSGGLLRSTDGGSHWMEIVSVPPGQSSQSSYWGVPCVLINGSSSVVNGRSSRVYVGVKGQSGGVFSSIDGGDSFVQISNTILDPYHIRLDSSGALYVSNKEKGLYRYEKGQWSNNLRVNCTGFDVAHYDINRLVAVTHHKQDLWISTDRGVTWTNAREKLIKSHGWFELFNAFDRFEARWSISLDPHHIGHATLATAFMCYHTEDIWANTIQWETWHEGIQEVVPMDVVSAPGNSTVLHCYADIPVLRHAGGDFMTYPTDRGIETGVTDLDYYAKDNTQVWYVNRKMGVIRTTDNGTTWQSVNSTGLSGSYTMAGIAVSSTLPDNVVICSPKGNRYTIDGGNTWKRTHGLPANLQAHSTTDYWYYGKILTADRVNGNFYAYEYKWIDGHKGQIYKSEDKGANWSVVANNLPSAYLRQKGVNIASAYNKEGYLILGADWANEVWYSTDGGSTWTKITGFNEVIAADFGKAAPFSTDPVIWILGQKKGTPVAGVYMSSDFFTAGTPSWSNVAIPEFALVDPSQIKGCENHYGRVYVGCRGQGWAWGQMALACTSPAAPVQNSPIPGNARVRVSWSMVEGVEGYGIKYGLSKESLPNVVYVGGDTTNSRVIPDLKNGVNYYFAVTAIRGDCESESSNIMSAEPVWSSTLLSDDFSDGNMTGWTIVDEGENDAPSDWSVIDGEVTQISNIYGGYGGVDATMDQTSQYVGTFAFWNTQTALTWSGYEMNLDLRSSDGDGIGVMFYYTDADNYYRFVMDHQRTCYQLIKKANGSITRLAEDDQGAYVIDHDYHLAVRIDHAGHISVKLDNDEILSASGETSLSGGTVALYSWGNTGAFFDNVRVTDLTNTGIKASEYAERDQPSRFQLHQNYPNPFNPLTRIQYTLPVKARVTLDIYDLLGKKVRTLFDGHQNAGEKSVVWNGLSSTGQSVASGVYIYTLFAVGENIDFTEHRKMLLMK